MLVIFFLSNVSASWTWGKVNVLVKLALSRLTVWCKSWMNWMVWKTYTYRCVSYFTMYHAHRVIVVGVIVFTFNVATHFSPPFLHFPKNQGHPPKPKHTFSLRPLDKKFYCFLSRSLPLQSSSPFVNLHCWSADFQLYLICNFFFRLVSVHERSWSCLKEGYNSRPWNIIKALYHWQCHGLFTEFNYS